MQLTAVLPNVISYDAALQLFNCILSAGQEGLSGSRPQEFDGDAAGCCSARCHFLQFRHQCLWKRQQRQQAALQQTAGPPIVISYNAALPLFAYSVLVTFSACGKGHQWQQACGDLAVLQQTAVLPDVMSCSAASVLVESASDASRPWLFWRRCSRLLFAKCYFMQCRRQCLWEGVLLQLAVLPSVTFCSAAISACGKGQQGQQALGVLEAPLIFKFHVLQFEIPIISCKLFARRANCTNCK